MNDEYRCFATVVQHQAEATVSGLLDQSLLLVVWHQLERA